MKTTPPLTLQHVLHERHAEAGPSGDNLRHQHHVQHDVNSDSDEGHPDPETTRVQRHSQRSYSVFAEEDEYRRLSFDDHEESGHEQLHCDLQLTTTEHISSQQDFTGDEHVHPQDDGIMVAPQRPEDTAQRIARQDARVRGVTRARQARHRQDRQDPQFEAALNHTQSLMSGTMVLPLFRLGQREACTNCGALLFMHERSWGHLCCMKGQVVLPTIQEQLPVSNTPGQDVQLQNHALKSIFKLWSSQCRLGQTLRKYARQVNNALAMASVTAASEISPSHGSWKPSVVICGKVYTRLGSLINTAGSSPAKFAQLWYHDPEHDLEQAFIDASHTCGDQLTLLRRKYKSFTSSWGTSSVRCVHAIDTSATFN